MRSARRQQGMTLIEVLVSLVLFAVAIVGLLRTLGTAMRDSGEVEFRTVAANLASARLGAMWIDRSNLASYVEANTALTELPNGTRTVLCLPTANVSNPNDSGLGSLRRAMLDVCTSGQVTFAPALNNHTILLTTGPILITRTVTVADNVVSIVIHWQVPGSDAQRTYSTMATLAVNN